MHTEMEAARRGRILLVTDASNDKRGPLREGLEQDGHEVVTVGPGAPALAAIGARAPDCALVDFHHAGADSANFCRAIRGNPANASTAIIVLSDARDVASFDRAMRAGADDFIAKPVAKGELTSRIGWAIAAQRLRVQLSAHLEFAKNQRDALTRAQLGRDELAAFIVHDLKTPVHAIDLYAQVILRTHALAPAIIESAEHIRSEARALSRMIMNLLDVSLGAESGVRPARVDVELRPLIDEVLESLSMKARTLGVTFEVRLEAARIDADPHLLRRIIDNLVGNALRYAPKGSRISVSSARSGGNIELRVSDAGEGVPQAMKEKIFERYAQLEDATHSGATNRGLGLAFCKLAAEAHGGSIWVEGAEPGSVFCVSLPSGDKPS